MKRFFIGLYILILNLSAYGSNITLNDIVLGIDDEEITQKTHFPSIYFMGLIFFEGRDIFLEKECRDSLKITKDSLLCSKSNHEVVLATRTGQTVHDSDQPWLIGEKLQFSPSVRIREIPHPSGNGSVIREVWIQE